MQWAVALGCIDIMYATVVLSRFRPAPRKVHISKIQHLYGYLKKYTSTSINFNTDILSYDKFKTLEVKWGNLYYVDPEYLPHSCPTPMGKPILVSIFVDANLMADLNTGRSQTGIIHLLNKTPIEWYSKLKSCI